MDSLRGKPRNEILYLSASNDDGTATLEKQFVQLCPRGGIGEKVNFPIYGDTSARTRALYCV